MGISLTDLQPKQVETIDTSNLKENNGLNLADLTNQVKQVEYKQFLDKNSWCSSWYGLDIETFNYNAEIRCVQIADYENRVIHYFVNGKAKDNSLIKERVNSVGYSLHINELENEKELIESVFSFLMQNPCNLIGHNIANFDLGMLINKKKKYGIKGCKFYGYTVGSGEKKVHLNFSWGLIDKEKKDVDFNNRFLIVDTLYMAFTLGVPAKLKNLAEKSPFPKKEIDYKEFENSNLSCEAVLYSIYDVLSLPYVYQDLISRVYDVSVKSLKPEKRASQMCYEHVWMKGSGCVAEAYLYNLIGRKSPYLPDFQTKYFGGITRDWRNEKVFPGNGKGIRNLDLTSAYPFAIAHQSILDILHGDFEELHNTKFDRNLYDRLIYSSVIKCKAKQSIDVLIEVERQKDEVNRKEKRWDEGHLYGLGFIKSFDKNEKVQDVQHNFAVLRVRKRGEESVLTKAEYEMNKEHNPNFNKLIIPIKIEYGFAPTNDEKSKQYVELYGRRKELKSMGDPSEKGIKVLLNSCYGKLAEMSGEWYCKALAAAITGFVRVELFKLLSYASKKEVDLIYSDTDSIYLKANEKQIKELQKYSNNLNPLPKELFEKDNLDDEGEEIVLFHAVKRKRYTKVIVDEDGIEVVVKGGSHRDITWRHVLFNLSLITNSYTVEGIIKTVESLDFPEGFGKKFDKEKFEALCSKIYHEYKGETLQDIFPFLSDKKPYTITMARRISLRRTKNYDSGTYHYYAVKAWQEETWRNKLKRDGITEYEDYLTLKEQLDQSKKERKQLSKQRINKWQQFYDLLKDELQDEGYGEWFSEEETIKKGYSYYFRKLAKHVNLKPELERSRFYLHLFEKLREYDLLNLMNKLSPESVEVVGLPDLNSHINYLDQEIDRLEEGKKGLERRVEKLRKQYSKEEPYIGLFFEIYDGYRFDDSHIGKFVENGDFSLNYELYATPPKRLPVIDNGTYMDMLFRSIDVDTITFIMRNGVNLRNLDNRKEITKAVYNFYQSGIDKKNAPTVLRSLERVLLIKLRLNGYEDIDQADFLKNEDKDTYPNSVFHISPQTVLRASLRVNKWRLVDEETNIFSLYYKASKIQNLARLLLEELFKQNGIDIELPPFSMIYQLDVSQPSEEEFAKTVYMESWAKPFVKQSINETIQCEFTNYLVLNAYNKKRSAENKIKMYKMTEKEREYFEKEAEEGWRSEIKFKLQRGLDEVISYAFVFDVTDHNSFIDFIKNSESYYNNVPNNFYKKKLSQIELKAWINGLFGFGRDRVIVLFVAKVMVRGQVIELQGVIENLPPLSDLEHHGLNNDKLPPHFATCNVDNIRLLKGCKRLSVTWFFDSKDAVSIDYNKEDHNKSEMLMNGGEVVMNRV